LLEAGGLVVFFRFYIGGLKKKISSLEEATNAKNTTIETLKDAIADVDNIKQSWKDFAADLPKAMDDYKSTYEKIIASKDLLINHLDTNSDLKKYIKSKGKETNSLD
jgi:hypothetical protein